jgi:hypothetical protein
MGSTSLVDRSVLALAMISSLLSRPQISCSGFRVKAAINKDTKALFSPVKAAVVCMLVELPVTSIVLAAETQTKELAEPAL